MYTRTVLVIATLGILLASAVPVTANNTTISTGEVHVYNDDLGQACPRVITTWTVTLTLLDPQDTDAVGLTVGTIGWGIPPGGAHVATSVQPTVSVSLTQSHGCAPPTLVTGIVADDTAYDLSFRASPGSLSLPIR